MSIADPADSMTCRSAGRATQLGFAVTASLVVSVLAARIASASPVLSVFGWVPLVNGDYVAPGPASHFQQRRAFIPEAAFLQSQSLIDGGASKGQERSAKRYVDVSSTTETDSGDIDGDSNGRESSVRRNVSSSRARTCRYRA